MDKPLKLIRVSRSSYLNKLFKVTEQQLREKLSGDELAKALKQLPTDDEKEFTRIFESNAPELLRLQRKMSVCLDAEVSKLENDLVEYAFNNKTVSVSTPKNSWFLSRKLADSKHDALYELNEQGCILVDGKKIDLTTFEVDEINLLLKIVDKFFFMIYL